MKNYIPFLTIIFIGLLISGCNPDLVVNTIATTGSPTVTSDGSVSVPIRFIVKNIGGDNAGIFKVSTEYTNSAGQTFTVAFEDPLTPPFDWYRFTTSPLAGGSEKEFRGNVMFHPSVRGVTVPIKAIADSGSGDEFMPPYIRVDESNETNNISTPLSVTLP